MSELPPQPSRSEWHGDATDGIEFRYKEGDVDEICLYVAGECVLHVEQMDDQCFWMGFYVKGHTAHANVVSKNGRSHIGFVGMEGWKS